jgi:hypothetical protein
MKHRGLAPLFIALQMNSHAPMLLLPDYWQFQVRSEILTAVTTDRKIFLVANFLQFRVSSQNERMVVP